MYQKYFASRDVHPFDKSLDESELDAALKVTPSEEYDKWLQVGMALKSAEYPLSKWESWSQKSAKYQPGLCADKWATFNGSGIGLGTLFHIAKQHDYKPKKRQRTQATAGTVGHIDVARQLIRSYGDGNLIYSQNRFYHWSGTWKVLLESEIAQREMKSFEELGVSKMVTASSVGSVERLVRHQTCSHVVFDRQRETVAFLNGELNLVDGDFELRPHVREHYRCNVIPHEYDPQAKAPRFERFLEEVFRNDPDKAEKKKALLQYMGLSLTSIVRYETYLILIGVGANGKSVVLAMVKLMVGDENTASVDPGQFDNRFQLSFLRGKLVNLVPEIAEGFQINDARLKSIVSGEPQTVEEKYQSPYIFRPHCKLWLAGNHLPHTRDVSPAFFRRPIVLEFNETFQGEARDTRLIDDLQQEIPGIINLALGGLKEVLKNGKVSEPSSSFSAKKVWQRDADQVAQFIDECCNRDRNTRCPFGDLYQAYLGWSTSSGIEKKINKNSFSRRLKTYGISHETGSSGTRFVRGVRPFQAHQHQLCQ